LVIKGLRTEGYLEAESRMLFFLTVRYTTK